MSNGHSETKPMSSDTLVLLKRLTGFSMACAITSQVMSQLLLCLIKHFMLRGEDLMPARAHVLLEKLAALIKASGAALVLTITAVGVATLQK